MGKYDPLRRFLASAPANMDTFTLSFQQVEQLLGDPLPYTARHQRSWWANEARSGTYSQAESWLSADWRVDVVDAPGEWVRFRR